MKAVILAAGRGKRMKNLTVNRPKCLIKFRGKSLLDWQLIALREAGIDDIAIVTGYKREMLAELGLKEFNNPNWANTNMVSSLVCAGEWLQSEPCIVSYSDIFYKTVAIAALSECKADLAVTYDPNWLFLWQKRFGDPLSDAETFRLKADGNLKEIGGIPQTIEEIQGQYMGLLRFTPRSWNETIRIRAGLTNEECNNMHMTGMLQKIIEARIISITAIPYTGKWCEFDSPGDLNASLVEN